MQLEIGANTSTRSPLVAIGIAVFVIEIVVMSA